MPELRRRATMPLTATLAAVSPAQSTCL